MASVSSIADGQDFLATQNDFQPTRPISSGQTLSAAHNVGQCDARKRLSRESLSCIVTLLAWPYNMARLVHLVDVGADSCTIPIVTLQGFATLMLVTIVLSAARMTETVPLP